MPLFQIGYRRWEGTRSSHLVRWWPITRTGLTIAWRGKLVRRLVLASFLPLLYFGGVFFLVGRLTDPGNAAMGGAFDEIARAILGRGLVDQLRADPTAVRSAVWAVVFASFATFFQLLLAGLVAAVAGPPLISDDLRSRSFLIYFARPISRVDYIIGKAGVLVALLAAVTLLPALVLHVLSILFSPSLETVVHTAPVVASMVLASLVAIVPAALVVLTLSSLTRQPRFAAAAWAMLCLFGPLVHLTLQQTRGLRDTGLTFLVSLPHTVRALQLALYDVHGRVAGLRLGGDLARRIEELSPQDSPALAAAWLALLSSACVLWLLRRADAPTRA